MWIAKRGPRRGSIRHQLVVDLRGKSKVPLLSGNSGICIAKERPVMLYLLPPVYRLTRPVWHIWIHWRSRGLRVCGSRWWGWPTWRPADFLEYPQLGHIVVILGSVPVS